MQVKQDEFILLSQSAAAAVILLEGGERQSWGVTLELLFKQEAEGEIGQQLAIIYPGIAWRAVCPRIAKTAS